MMGRRCGSWLAMIAVVGVCPAPAVARSPARAPVTPGSDYLALGDSVAFGFEDVGTGQSQNPFDVAAIVGYPEMLAGQLHLNVANAACPGESSSSMINPAGQSDGCEDGIQGLPGGYRSKYPLHVRYSGPQLSYALAYLSAHRNVRLVTVQTGLADLSLCQTMTPDNCASLPEIDALDARVQANVRTILSAIRAQYTGQLVVVSYYSDDYLPSLENTLMENINTVLSGTARSYGAQTANGWGAFDAASADVAGDPCLAGLLDVVVPGQCGYHPTVAGQAILTDAIRKVIVVGK